MEKMGLKWLWRLVIEPGRWRRIWKAVVVFPWMVFRRGGE
jgi:N-acetylglucosaminyldiphosphoundecaprenol N-acetyl-beta-D-mannosaminyltransferase